MRTSLGIVIGALLAAAALCSAGETFLRLAPPPDWLDPRAPALLGEYLLRASLRAQACLLAGLAVAALAGAWVATRIARRHRGGAALAIGAPLTVLAITAAGVVPMPPWIPVVGMLLPIPIAVGAWRLALPRSL